MLRLPLLFALVVVLASQQPQPAAQPAAAKPPVTRSDNVKEILHGVEVTDPYRWLEDGNSAETRAWIDEQNRYTRSLLDPLPGRQSLEKRFSELLRVDSVGTPVERNGRYFFTKRRADQDLAIIYMREGARGEDQVLVDPHPLSADRRTSVSLMGVSRDGRLMAYGIRQGGQDEVSLTLLDVNTRKPLPDTFPKARVGSVRFEPDGRAFYYSRIANSGTRVYRHAVGSDGAQDPVIFGDGFGADKIVSPYLSEDGRYLLMHVMTGSAANQTDIYFQDRTKKAPFVPLVKDLPARSFAEIGGDHIFILTNWEAPRNRVMVAGVAAPQREHWRELIPQGNGVIDDLSLVGGRLFVNFLENANSRVGIYEPGGKHIRDISFPTLGTVTQVTGRWSSPEGFFSFTSYHVPSTIYRYDVAGGAQDVWWRSGVPVNSDAFELKQVWYRSKDGTRVPMFLLHRKGLKLDGNNPVYLTGYGGFNVSRTPEFSSWAVAWGERGVFAVANLRGGGEFGKDWHRAGMLEKKQNVFDDCIAAAEWLIENRYTRPERLAVGGGSNGGLLAGAMLVQRPDLFGAIMISYPLIDMLRYHRFLIARLWVPEYGSAEDPKQFQYLRAYSPYHNVKRGAKYPAVLVVTGDGDTRVDPLHGRKMAALLQASSGSGRPVLLHYDTKSGHSGGRPISRQIADLVDQMSFLLWQLGSS